MRNVILYIAMSLDGYIADQNDGLDFLSRVEQEGEDYGYQAFIDSVDTVIIGRKTYEKVISLGVEVPHADKECYVISRSLKSAKGKAKIFSGDLSELVHNLKKKKGENIFVDGGAEIANELLRLNLIDELIISIIPVLLGDGIMLFSPGRPQTSLKLIDVKHFDKGLVQLHYRKN
ncbi:MAG: dihydrofolate reductase [Bacteroidales bacterium]|nr:dihydrofolate reductase [Bacteroidales bacterium]MCB9000091.1 dihydrofolate reductase [Bacteroidales bacterium]MCB9012740.1 dihydrofolate reductase [Bacteroidales bacterium]